MTRLRTRQGPTNSRRRTSWRAIECLEFRIVPATATLSAGVLAVDYTATGSTVESVAFTDDGTNIILSGNVTGSLSNPVVSVNQIILTASGSSNTQSATFAGAAPFSLSGGISSSNVETININNAL